MPGRCFAVDMAVSRLNGWTTPLNKLKMKMATNDTPSLPVHVPGPAGAAADWWETRDPLLEGSRCSPVRGAEERWGDVADAHSWWRNPALDQLTFWWHSLVSGPSRSGSQPPSGEALARFLFPLAPLDCPQQGRLCRFHGDLKRHEGVLDSCA